MKEIDLNKAELRVADLRQNQVFDFLIVPSNDELAAIADELGLLVLRKLRFSGELRGIGRRDWRLDAKLGATVQQPCVATLAPVTTRIETEAERHFLSDFSAPNEEEFEITDDENVEALAETIDLKAILVETLALNLPLYPRAEGANLESSVFTEPGKQAMTDEDVRPFAGLAALRDQLSDKGEK